MPSTYWRLTLAFALATLLMSGFILPLFPTTSHGDVSGYGSPVFAFEMVSSLADMERVFGPENDPLRPERIAQMDNGNYWDFAFMFFYAMFMALFNLAAYKQTQNALWFWSALIGLSAGVFDAVENVMLLELTENFNSPTLLTLLWMPVYAKFYAISLSSFGAALYLFWQANASKQASSCWAITWKLIGLVAMIASLSTMVALSNASQYGWLLQHSITLCWVPMLVFSAIRAFKSVA